LAELEDEMAAQPHRAVEEGDESQIISPFAQTTSSVRPERRHRRGSWMLWAVSAVLAVVVLGNVAYFTLKYVNNPYRTLEPFSVDKYLADFQPLAGSKFGADLKVVADLGWKEDVGRLMVFNSLNDTRPILVLIPPRLAGIYFAKGQTYQVALEVGEGGLIYADSCDKD
jgi:hypothetical protein